MRFVFLGPVVLVRDGAVNSAVRGGGGHLLVRARARMVVPGLIFALLFSPLRVPLFVMALSTLRASLRATTQAVFVTPSIRFGPFRAASTHGSRLFCLPVSFSC
jgi:hypothetical protein